MPAFRIRKKNLVYPAVIITALFFLASFIPASRTPLLDTLRAPLGVLTFFRRQAEALIFYQRNFTQNERLKKEVDLLKHKILSLEEAQAENGRLKALLLLKEKSPYKVITARVIARPADNWSSVIIIDKGRYNGINKGMPVINYFGLIGRVVDVSESLSRVMLMNSPDFAVSAIIRRSRQEGLVSGVLGNSLVMRYLPQEADIQLSDSVITSGLTGSYPKGLFIGTVTGVGQEFGGLSRYAVIKPAVDLSGIEEVLVIVR